MEKRRISPRGLLITAGLIAIIVLLATVYAYYKNSLIHFSGNIDKDYFPAFGSFVGGTMGIIISIVSVLLIYYTYQSQQEQLSITRALVDRQISFSVKPDLVVEEFRSTRSPMEKLLNDTQLDGILPRNLQTVNLKILNIGIEAAKYVEYSFFYDLDDLMTYYAEKINNKMLEFDYIDKNHVVAVRMPGIPKVWGFAVINEQAIVKRDYLLPCKLQSDYFEATFPTSYLIFYYQMMSDKFIGVTSQNMDEPLAEFPKCYLNLSFHDLEGKVHTKRFHTEVGFAGQSFKSESGIPFPKQWEVRITTREVL